MNDFVTVSNSSQIKSKLPAESKAEALLGVVNIGCFLPEYNRQFWLASRETDFHAKPIAFTLASYISCSGSHPTVRADES